MMAADSAFPDGLGDGLTAAQVPSVLVSAAKGLGMDRLLQVMEDGLTASREPESAVAGSAAS